MAPQGEAANVAQTKKVLKRKPSTIPAFDVDDDSDFTIEASPKVTASKRKKRTRAASAKLSGKSTELAALNVLTNLVLEGAELERFPYWQRRRILNPNVPYKEPTAKQAADAAADWGEGQYDPAFPDFELYDIVIQDPKEDDVITSLSTEPHKRMGDLQFLLRTRYEDPIDEARNYHEVLFVFKYDMPADKEQRYPRYAAVKDGQIQVARVWTLREVTDRQGAWEKCRADEEILLNLVLGQAELAKVSLEQWKEKMGRAQLKPQPPNLDTINLDQSRPLSAPLLTNEDVNPNTVGNEALTSNSNAAKRSPASMRPEAVESDIRPPEKAPATPALPSLAVNYMPALRSPAPRASEDPIPADSARPLSEMTLTPTPTVAPGALPALTGPSPIVHLQSGSIRIPTDAEVFQIATKLCPEVHDEVRKHFARCDKYIMETVHQAIRKCVSIAVPASQTYTEELWKQTVNKYLVVQQKDFERRWYESHPGRIFQLVSPHPLARQLSFFIASYAINYPIPRATSKTEVEVHVAALQRAAMKNQEGLLMNWAKYWADRGRSLSAKSIYQQGNTEARSETSELVQSVSGDRIGTFQVDDDQAIQSDMLRREHKRTEDVELDVSKPLQQIKRQCTTDLANTTINPQLLDLRKNPDQLELLGGAAVTLESKKQKHGRSSQET